MTGFDSNASRAPRVGHGDVRGSIGVIPSPDRPWPIGIAHEAGRIGGHDWEEERDLGPVGMLPDSGPWYASSLRAALRNIRPGGSLRSPDRETAPSYRQDLIRSQPNTTWDVADWSGKLTAPTIDSGREQLRPPG
jgi:hypothetical protein